MRTSLDLCVCLLTLCVTTLEQTGPGVKVVVKEDSDAVLPCSLSPKEDITGEIFHWRKDESQKEVFFYDSGIHYNNDLTGQDQQFKGRVSHFQNQLKNGDASIKINNTKMADSGNYSCFFPGLQPRQTFNIELVVEPILRDRSGEIPGASPKPYVTSLDETKDRSLLQCEVLEASPKPKVEWQDSTGNILPAEEPQVSERGGSYYVTLNTTVTKTGHYRCVATQEDINHQIYSETYVHLNESMFGIYCGEGVLVKMQGMPHQSVVDMTALKSEGCISRAGAGNILPAEEPQVSERGGSYCVTLNTTVTKTGRCRCVATQEDINHQTSAETFLIISAAVH
ncbi:CD276 antigen homolog [Pagrus major]|uniref:CD276 antigen homolog n=1 Tax=Pagrus major TaxID=143350 RepID=UPI003CC8AF23